MKKEITRKFLGELFPEKKRRNFEKAHLKAYLKGQSHFRYGKTKEGQPAYFKVEKVEK